MLEGWLSLSRLREKVPKADEVALMSVVLFLPAPPSPVALRAPASPASGRGEKAA